MQIAPKTIQVRLRYLVWMHVFILIGWGFVYLLTGSAGYANAFHTTVQTKAQIRAEGDGCITTGELKAAATKWASSHLPPELR